MEETSAEEARPNDWRHHPIDIRLSIPTLLSRYYLVVLVGPERRDEARRREERKSHPFFTRNNLWFTGILIGAMLYLAAWVGLGFGASVAFALL